MDKNQIKESQVNSWEYIPDPDTLIEYLDREDIIELSKCSKFYRKQLESKLWEYLNLHYWENNYEDLYNKLLGSKNIKKVFEFMKADLGSKLKYVKKFELHSETDCSFAEIFINLFPNIKTLIWNDYSEWDFEQENNLTAILNRMEHLEQVKLIYNDTNPGNYSTRKQIFPKSLKSLYIDFDGEYYFYLFDRISFFNYICIFDTIDSSYINLFSITIISNRMLQNLSFKMPNLQEVKIQVIDKLDESKILTFLKANRQLRKLEINSRGYNRILGILLSSKCLEYLDFQRGNWKEAEINIFPHNYSIKYLKIDSSMPAPIVLQLINACKRLKTLDLKLFSEAYGLDLSKLEKRINKIIFDYFTSNTIREIDSSKLFNEVHLQCKYSIKKFMQDDNIDKLKNYKFIRLLSGVCILKLTNKSD